jgi:hypothetical protein
MSGVLGRVYKKFGLFFKRLYLCTPFTENRQNGLYERRVGQSVKTPPFHGGMRGSTPLRGTTPAFKQKVIGLLY